MGFIDAIALALLPLDNGEPFNSKPLRIGAGFFLPRCQFGIIWAIHSFNLMSFVLHFYLFLLDRLPLGLETQNKTQKSS